MTAVKEAVRDSTTVKCAFCKGEGTDPFGLLSPSAVCQVCGGKRVVTVIEPAIECAFCKGSGVFHPDKRLTCTVCGGKGMVTVTEPSEECARCKGRGVLHGDYLPCLTCKGKGVVLPKKNKTQSEIAIISSRRNVINKLATELMSEHKKKGVI